MVVDVRTHLDLFDLNDLLLFLGLRLFLLLLIFEFAVIENFAYGRRRSWRDFDKIKAGFSGDGDGFGGFYNAALFTMMVDQENLRDVDVVIDARAGGFCRAVGEGSACYELLSIGCFRLSLCAHFGEKRLTVIPKCDRGGDI
jgi:hypothetical protein